MVTNAVASEPPAPVIGVPFTAPPATGEGTDLVSRLGNARTAGSWIDSAGRPVVAVTDEKAAAEVKRAGAQAKMVRHSMSDLKSAASTLRSAPGWPEPRGLWTTRATRWWCGVTAPSPPPPGPG